MKKFLIAIIVLLVIALVVGGGLLIWYNVDQSSAPGNYPGNTIPGSTSPLSHDGEVLGQTLGATGEEYRIDVNAEEFDVKIVANNECLFEFYHNDNIATFPYFDVDWSEYFGIVKGDGYFTFNNSNRSLLKVLGESLYPDETLAAISNVDSEVAYFGIIVTIGDKQYGIHLVGWYATTITLSSEEVYF